MTSAFDAALRLLKQVCDTAKEKQIDKILVDSLAVTTRVDGPGRVRGVDRSTDVAPQTTFWAYAIQCARGTGGVMVSFTTGWDDREWSLRSASQYKRVSHRHDFRNERGGFDEIGERKGRRHH